MFDSESAPATETASDHDQLTVRAIGDDRALTDRAVADPGLRETLRGFSDLAYRDLFWPRRRYEDAADRIAIRAMLPATGDRLVEVGAGFGRLADEYRTYAEVVLVEPSDALLAAARETLGADQRFTLVAGDAYRLPFPDACFDAVVCVRVIHHMHDPKPAIREFVRVLRPGGVLVLESANKRNLKAVIATWLRRRRTSAFARGTEAYEGLSLMPEWLRRVSGSPPNAESAPQDKWEASTSFVHSPVDLRSWLRAAGLEIRAERSVGLLRVPTITRRIPLHILIPLERLAQVVLSGITAGPSLFIMARRRADPGASEPGPPAGPATRRSA